MKKIILLTLASVLCSVASFASYVFTAGGVCVGSSATLTDSISGGTWSSSNTAIATIDLTTGVVTGVSAGTCDITYTVGIMITTEVFTVTSAPASISGGPVSICVGSTATLSDATTGGVWSSSAPWVASVGSSTGVVTGVSGSWLSDISYTTGPGCSATLTVTINATPTPDSVYGPSGVCIGSTISMSDGTSGGVWSSSSTAIATVTSGGVVTGVSAGWATISYAVTGTCGTAYAPAGYVLVSATPVAGTITGPSTVCAGATIHLSDGSTGGVWSSSNTAIATVVSYSGVVTGISTGTADITYTVTNPCGSVYTVQTITVAPGATIGAISGPSSVCAGSTISLTDATTGGVWSSGSTAIATVSGGTVTGMSSGIATISYGVTGSCGTIYATATVSVLTTAIPDSITGLSTVCLGSTTVLSDLTSGGAWSSSSTAIATVSSGGVVTGIATGIAHITYTVSGTCGSAYVTRTISVISTVSAGTISGSSTVMTTLTTTLYDGVSGGVWSSSNSAIASVNPTTGLVTGNAAGTATITYAVTGCGGTSYATFVITVTAANIISGNVNFTGTPYNGMVKVWLITYNTGTTDLEAIDSTMIYCYSGSSVYYQFLGEPTDSYRIKAATVDSSSLIGSTGYVPTYHSSYFYWYAATVLPHVAGTVDAGQDINMLTGTITAGPGFVGGSVLTGANKGTSSAIPAVGLTIYLLNSATGTIIQQTLTDATGVYSFANLPVGATYYVHPEALNYLTTDYTAITLTSDAPRVATASFIQHTISLTITPITEGVKNLTQAAASVITFPNPASGKLNIQWQEPTAEKATVTISDIAGREISKTSINMNQGAGVSQLDLSELTNGLYMISIKSAAINYNSKVQVQR